MTKARGRGARRARRTGAGRTVTGAVSLAWRADPLALSGFSTLSLLASAAPVSIAWLTKLLIDGLIAKRPAGTLIGLMAAIAVLSGLAAVLPHVTQFLRTELDRKVGTRALERLFLAVERIAGMSRFEDPPFLDRLRLAQQSCNISPHPNQAVDAGTSVLRSGLTIMGFIGSLFVLAPTMTVIVVLAGAPVMIAELKLSRQRAKVVWDIGPAERREFFYADLLSSVEAAKEIRLFGIGGYLRDRMLDNRHEVNAAKRAVDRRERRLQSALGLLSAAVTGLGLIWAIREAGAGRISVGDITVFIAALAGVQTALVTMAEGLARAHQALAMFEHYLAVLDTPGDVPAYSTSRPAPALRHGIELRDVWFRYSHGHPWILQGIDLYIPYGRTVALVGLNGAGKSTLVKLLCRLYEPTHGTILWDGVDVRSFDIASLRWRIGVVFQDYMQYDMTAAENIALGDLNSLHEPARIVDAAVRAGIDDKLRSLPQGYQTLLSRMFFVNAENDTPESGVVLSGGQWQRLALARALLRDQCDLMILDEPSAGLDAEAEHQVHTTLRRHREGRTSLLISHRLSAVRDAGTLLVLSGGRVVEFGDHQVLMRRGGEYHRLFSLQAAGYSVNGAER